MTQAMTLAINEEKNKAIKVIRSIIISIPQRGETIRQLVRYYRDSEGKHLDKFGHRSLEDFLRESGEFVFENFKGELIVYEKPNDDSKHMAKLVTEQKRKKRSSTKYGNRVWPAERKSININNAASMSSSPRQTTGYNNQVNLSVAGDAVTEKQRNDQAILQERRYLPTTSYTFEELEAKDKSSIPSTTNNNNRVSLPSQEQVKRLLDLRDRLKGQRGNYVKESSQSIFEENGKQEIKQASATNISIKHSNCQSASRIQDRLKNQPKFDIHTLVNKATLSKEKKTMSERLAQARLNHNSGTPTHRVNLTRDIAKAFDFNVNINEDKYSTYPTDYKNEHEARSETANSRNSRSEYPTCLDEDVELVKKIYNCLKESPGGVFYTKIPEIFQAAHRQSLPVEWELLIKYHPKLFTVENCINDKIVYIVEQNEIDKIEQKIDKLMLPWKKTHWNLMVTYIISTVEIWGRLIDGEYRHHFETLMNDIEQELITNKNVAKELKVGQIYLVSMSECGYRVRIEKVDHSRKQCLCFFIDDGDQVWFDMNDLYICQNKFAKYPAQAKRFALYGLEDFAENEFGRPNLNEVLLDQELIGKIVTKEEDFIRLDESDDMEPRIQVVLYDRSTDDGINLNQLMVEKICSVISAPKLQQTLTPVYISHIADNGDVFCQLQVNGMDYVNKLIRKYTEDTSQCGLPAWDGNDVTNRKLFFVFDEPTSKWCRANVLQKGLEGNKMFFIDYGKTEIVPLSKIFGADSFSQALLNYPPQAIRTKLYGIDDVPQKVSLLRGYFNPNTLAYMKVCTLSDVPEVNLYHVNDSLITNIKDSFDLEKEYNHAKKH